MPGIVQLQNQYNPFQRQLPSFLSNLLYQRMSQNFHKKQLEELRRLDEQKELRTYKAAGYRESEAHTPDIEVGGKGLMEPTPSFQVKMVNGRPFIVKGVKKYGETEATTTDMSELKNTGAYKVGNIQKLELPVEGGTKKIIAQYTGNPQDTISLGGGKALQGFSEVGSGDQ